MIPFILLLIVFFACRIAGLLWAPAVKASLIGLAILLLAVFPANVHAARHRLTIDGRKVPGLAVCTLMQIIFLAAVIAAGWG